MKRSRKKRNQRLPAPLRALVTSQILTSLPTWGKTKLLPKSLKDQVHNWGDFEHSPDGNSRVSSFAYGKRRLVVSYSARRAAKDRGERAVEKLMKRLAKGNRPDQLLSNYGYKKFIKMEGDSRVSVDLDKVELAQKWDGLHVVVTNLEDFDAIQVLWQYRGLWQVEETFRISKHDLKVRPIFHCTPRRVHAHIAISFMALMCVRHLEYQFALQYQRHSAQQIRNALLHTQFCVVQHKTTARRYAIPLRIGDLA